MRELKGRLRNELLKDINVKVLDSQSWGLPVQSIEISYQTVKRSKMDILMKMVLIAFRKAEIETAEELSEILLVEPLFINDIIHKMLRSRLIEKKGVVFTLTAVGIQQLEAGVFEHEPVDGSKEALFSLCHQDFLNGELEDVPKDELDLYRLLNEFDDLNITSIKDNALLKTLKTLGVESDEGNVQNVISNILTASELQLNVIPCLEFRLHNETEDIIYARVWNTLTEEWDEKLEEQINEKERIQWRKIYLQNV